MNPWKQNPDQFFSSKDLTFSTSAVVLPEGMMFEKLHLRHGHKEDTIRYNKVLNEQGDPTLKGIRSVGPITLFDKSFLQSLSVDESVWFDHFFLANVCPLFYVETLADLEKSVRQGRTPEQEVGLIADKFPEMHGSPNAYHVELCLQNLMGRSIPLNGQIPLVGGRTVKVNEKTGVLFDLSPEAEAFTRWQRHEFTDIERLHAKAWREGGFEFAEGRSVYFAEYFLKTVIWCYEVQVYFNVWLHRYEVSHS
ncbi:MAG TPA: hypothetical protein VMW72_06665 [Sedimentisphaerales bacterium]|nr:hypothetical protein [Sedimentisphaerales bacterium]